MNTKTMKGKSLGIILSLALILSLVAVALPVQPVKAACTSVVINSPTTAAKDYIKTGGTVSVDYNLIGDAVGTETVEIFIKNATTTIGWSGLLSRTSAAGPGNNYIDTITIPTAVAGSYDVYITVNAGACTDTETNAVVIDNTPPTVTLVTLNGGGCYEGGSSQDVSWIITDATSPGTVDVTMDYTTNAGSSWTNEFTDVSYAQGSPSPAYSWGTPTQSSSTCKIRIKAKDSAGNESAYVASASYFTLIRPADRPTVAVQAPNGGETLYGGDPYTISWNAVSSYSSALDYFIKLSTDNGATWPIDITSSWLTSQPTGDRTYSWTVPHVSSANCLIRVRARDCAGNIKNDDSDATFTIGDDTLPTVVVTAPTTGDNWYVGSNQTIAFSATDLVPGDFTGITIWLSTDGGSTWPYSVVYGGTLTQGNKTQAWTVTDIGTSSTNCKIKVCATDAASNEGCGVSGTFTISKDSNPPTVTLCAPNGGEQWQTGTVQTITWTANDTPDASAKMEYRLRYSTDSGSSWTTITTLPNQDQCSSCTCSYSWAVPDVGGTETDCRVEVRAKDPATNTTIDVSDADFEISANTCVPETASRSLQAGWNLISLELIPTSTNINTVLSSILPNVLSVWYYSGGPSGSWSSYAPGAPSSLTTMEAGKGYWINMSAGDTLTYQGRKAPCPPNSPPIYSYGTGWYLVGFRSSTTKTVSNYLGGTCGTTYLAPITWFDAATQTYDTRNCGGNMNKGRGYWVYFNSAHQIVAPVD